MSDPKAEGILLVDKEKGRTAFYLVKILRKISGIKKIGIDFRIQSLRK